MNQFENVIPKGGDESSLKMFQSNQESATF